MACEKCWADAWMLSQWNGKSQAENYQDLLAQRKENPCSAEEQKWGNSFNEGDRPPEQEQQ